MPDAPRQLPPKKDVAIALLEGPSVFVHLDPRREGVQVPKWFTGQPQLVLQVGLNMAIPIPDLRVEEDAITCTLSFNRAPFWCRLPWNAIYALVGEDSRGMVWPEDVPPEIATQMQKPQSGPASTPKTPAKKGKPKLNAVEGGGGDARDAKPKKEKGGREPQRLRPAAIRSAPSAPSPEEVTHDGEAEAAATPRAASTSAADDAAGFAERPITMGAATPKPPASRPPEAGKKPKRELPPYLRVIK